MRIVWMFLFVCEERRHQQAYGFTQRREGVHVPLSFAVLLWTSVVTVHNRHSSPSLSMHPHEKVVREHCEFSDPECHQKSNVAPLLLLISHKPFYWVSSSFSLSPSSQSWNVPGRGEAGQGCVCWVGGYSSRVPCPLSTDSLARLCCGNARPREESERTTGGRDSKPPKECCG